MTNMKKAAAAMAKTTTISVVSGGIMITYAAWVRRQHSFMSTNASH